MAPVNFESCKLYIVHLLVVLKSCRLFVTSETPPAELLVTVIVYGNNLRVYKPTEHAVRPGQDWC